MIELNNESNTLFETIIQNQALAKPAKEAEGKDIVLIVGLTGSGKTTLATYLAGNTMIEQEIDDKVCIVPEKSELADKIGHTGIAKTTMPELYPLSEVVFADTPGFEDTRGVQARIEASLSTELFVKKAKSVKAIIVAISAEHIDKRGTALTKVAELLGRFIILNAVHDNIFFVITNQEVMASVRESKRFAHLQKLIKEIYENYFNNIEKRVKELANIYSENEKEKAQSSLISMIETLHCLMLACEKGRMVLINWFTEGTRSNIIQWLMTLNTPVDKINLRFSHYDDLRIAFDNHAEIFLNEAITTFRDVASLSSTINLLHERLNVSEIKQHLDDMKNKIDSGEIRDLNSVIQETSSICENTLINLKTKKKEAEECIVRIVSEAVDIIKKLEGEDVAKQYSIDLDKYDIKQPLLNLKNMFIRIKAKQSILLKKIDQYSIIYYDEKFSNKTYKYDCSSHQKDIRRILEKNRINTSTLTDTLSPFQEHLLADFPVESLIEVATFFSFKENNNMGVGYKIIQDGDSYQESFEWKQMVSWLDYFKPRITIDLYNSISSITEAILYSLFTPFTMYLDLASKLNSPGQYSEMLDFLLKDILNQHVLGLHMLSSKVANLPTCGFFKAVKNGNLVFSSYYSSYWVHPAIIQRVEIVLHELSNVIDELITIDTESEKNKSIQDAIKSFQTLIKQPHDTEQLGEKFNTMMLKFTGIHHSDELTETLKQQTTLLEEKKALLKKQARLYKAVYLNHEILGQKNGVYISEFKKLYEEFSSKELNDNAGIAANRNLNSQEVSKTIEQQAIVTAVNPRKIDVVIHKSRQLQSKALFKEAEEEIAEASRNLAESLTKLELEELQAYHFYYQALQKAPNEACGFYESSLKLFARIYESNCNLQIAAMINEIMLAMGRRYNLNVINPLKDTPRTFYELKEILFNLVKSKRTISTTIFLEALKDYLSKGYDINTCDEFSNTLLNYAVMNDHSLVVRELLLSNARFDIANVTNDTAIDFIFNYGRDRFLSEFFEQEIKCFKAELLDKNYPILHKMVNHLAKSNSAATSLINSLIMKLEIPIRQQWLLLQYNGKKLWQHIAQFDLDKFGLPLFELFVPIGCDMYIPLLAEFIQANRLTLCQFILKRWNPRSIDLNLLLPNKKTVLALALEVGNGEMVQLLLRFGADVNKQFAHGMMELNDKNRKGFTSISHTRLSQAIQLPDEFIIGKSFEHGGCFFDSIAQALNAIAGINQHTEASLRSCCYQYYQANPNIVENWHIKDYAQGATIPDYSNILHNSNDHLTKTVFWGRPHVEGLIICRAFNLEAIQVIEIIPDADSQDISLGHYVITAENYQQCPATVFSTKLSTIIISKNDLHFLPVVPKDAVINIKFISPLRYAILKSNLGLVQLLLGNTKPKLMERDFNFQTLFHTATMIGHIEILKALYQAASSEERIKYFSEQDENGDTVWHLSLKRGDFTCFNWLLQTCLDMLNQDNNRINKNINEIVHIKNYRDESPLKTAVLRSDMRAVEALYNTPKLSFWNNNEAHEILLAAKRDNTTPITILNYLGESKIKHCLTLVKVHLQTYLNSDPFHKQFIAHWMARLEKVLASEQFAGIRERMMLTSIWPLQIVAEQLAINITRALREQYKTNEDLSLLKSNVTESVYHAWDQLLNKAVSRTMNVVQQKNVAVGPTGSLSYKTDKHRAFTRALKAGLRDYFYVSRALYEGEVLKNDETFNAVKAVFNVAAPSITQVSPKMPVSAPVGVILSVISASLELITKIKQRNVRIEAGRFVQAFGICGPNAVAKGQKDIEMDPDKLKAVCEVLYRRYRDQIEKCTIAYENKKIQLTPTSGIYVLAKAMADRIFQHIITDGSLLVENQDDRSVWQKITDKLTNLSGGKDVFLEQVKIPLPERCILAVVLEQVNTDTTDEVAIETSSGNDNTKASSQWTAGCVLSKPGLKLERNHSELYIREGTKEQQSLHDKYGYCYVSEEMCDLREIETRGFVKASKTLTIDNIREDDFKSISECLIM